MDSFKTLREVVTGNGTVESVEVEVKTKEQRIKELVKALNAYEEEMQPLKDGLKDLKKNYVENGWLDKEEIRLTIKAMRLVKDETDFEALQKVYENLSK